MKLRYTFFILTTLIIFSCASNKSNSIREAVLLSFDCLKNLQENDFAYYQDRMINFSDFKSVIHNDKMPDSIRKPLDDSITHERFLTDLEKSFNELRTTALQYNLLCKDFQYIDYTSETKTENGVEGIKGTLYFSYKGEVYLTDIVSVKLKNKYIVVVLEKLRPKDPPENED